MALKNFHPHLDVSFMFIPAMHRPLSHSKLMICTIAILSIVSMVRAGDITEGVLFYAPLDAGITSARLSEGNTEIVSEGNSRAAGKIAGAMRAGKMGLAWQQPGNFLRDQGTVSFWFRLPTLAAGAEEPEWINLFDAVNFQLVIKTKERNLLFMTGHTPSDGSQFVWDYDCVKRLPEGFDLDAWHHVALTWDASTPTKALYLDGKKVGTSTSECFRRGTGNLDWTLKWGDEKRPAIFDELTVWGRVLASGEVTALFDAPGEFAASAQKLPPPVQQVRHGLELQLASRDGSSILAPGAQVSFQVPVANKGATKTDRKVKVFLRDYFGKSSQSKEVSVTLEPGAEVKLPVAFTAPAETGIYKVTVERGADDLVDVGSFAVWPENLPKLSDESFFGMHAASFTPARVKDAARLGFRWNRAHNMTQSTWWVRAQPEPGPFVTTSDHQAKYNFENDIQLYGQFMGTPYWAAALGKLDKPPSDTAYPYGARPNLEAYAKYVDYIVRHFPEITNWEIGNEPQVSMFWGGSPEEFAEMCQVSIRVAKAANPKAQVSLAGFTTGWRWAERTAKAGAFQGADGISFHIYHSPTNPIEADQAQIREITAVYRKLIAENASRPDLPIIQSEGGSESTTFLEGLEMPTWPAAKNRPPYNWKTAAERMVQTDLTLIQLGFERSFSYLFNTESDYSGLNESDLGGSLKPKLIARAVLAHAVDRRTLHQLVTRNESMSRLQAFIFRGKANGSGSLAVVWTGEGGSVKPPPGMDKPKSLMGNEISGEWNFSESPIYVESPLPPAELAKLFESDALMMRTAAKPVPVPAVNEGAVLPSLPDYPAALENPRSLFTVDLSSYANAGLADEKAGDGQGGWADEGPFNDLRDLPTDKPLVAYGVPFKIIPPAQNEGKSIITLRGSAVTPSHPQRVEGIKLPGTKVRALYFLHATAWTLELPGKYVMHYSDGQTAELELIPGKNINDWWLGFAESEECKPVAVRVSNTIEGEPSWRYLRVYEWQNPRPDVPIVSFDFISSCTKTTPILLGVSGVRW